MTYLFFATICGIILFSSVTNEIFNYKVPQKVSQIIRYHRSKMEVFMFEVSARRTNQLLPLELIEMSKKHITSMITHSTLFHFGQNNLYQELPPTLRKKLVLNCLVSQRKAFKYFFIDPNDAFHVSFDTQMRILTILESHSYVPGETIIDFDTKVDNFVLIAEGQA